MFAVGFEDILSGKETFGNGEQTVSEEDYDEAQETDVLAVVGQRQVIARDDEQHGETHHHAAHIARKTTGVGPEVEEAEYEQGYEDGGQEVDVDIVLHEEFNESKGAYSHHGIGGQHAVDAVHKVVDIEHQHKEDDSEENLPQVQCGQGGPKHGGHCAKLYQHAQPCRERPEVVGKADHSQKGSPDEEMEVGKSMGA